MKYFSNELFITVRDNDNDALVPDLWAMETLEQLEKEMVMGMLVHRDFENMIQAFGDVVNAHRPADMEAGTKRDKQNVKTSDAISVNVPVKLDQWVHQSFLLGDGEVTKAFKDLIQLYIVPAARSIADRVDQILLMQVYNFMSNISGKLSQSLAVSTIIDARRVMQGNKVDPRDRRFVVGVQGEADLLNLDKFTDANTVGDDGFAMREAHIGRKYGFDFFFDQNVSSIDEASAADIKVYAVTAVEPKGETTIDLDANTSGEVADGSWVTIAGDDIPHRIVSHTGANTTQIVLETGLASGIAAGAEVVVYSPCLVDQAVTSRKDTGFATGFPIDYNEIIDIDGVTGSPQLGQLATTGASGSGINYGLVGAPSTSQVEFDRPLEAGLADNQEIFLGPAGEYSLAFHRNALALVSRPLAAPIAGSGARSFVAEYNGLTIRATITYDGVAQCTRVTLDMLCGVKVLNPAMGVAVLSS